ncbi:MAG: hypothetical protein ABIN74_04225 [Ferruginibacter sp.]
MSNISKLMLSDEEQQLVNNTGWILTKRVIIDKVCQLLADVAESQKEIIEKEKSWLPRAIIRSTPKIAKGENYLQLPYVLMDHPRCFDTADTFAVRTMFWWGNFFSMTLHVSGIYKELFQEKILENMNTAQPDIFICIHESQWHHHFEAHNYKRVNELSAKEREALILENQFVKLAVKFPLQQWNDIPALLDRSFKAIIEMLKG